MNGFGLVLGGGGAKGGYQIGVWKALKELDIPIEAVAGTSVGALNGAMMVQGDFELAYKLWTSISIENVINVERKMDAIRRNKKTPFTMLGAIKNAITSGGLDITPLKELLEKVIDENKIRESDIDFGMVTFSLTDFKPFKLFKKDIPEGKMVDYLLASACFPAFKPQEIDNKKYIDGGVYDNVPISLMIDKGIKNIIVVDISGVGIVRKVDTEGYNIIYIKNSEYLGGTLDFNPQRSKTNIEIGYYDTLKRFGKLKGHRYYIDYTRSFESDSSSYIQDFDFKVWDIIYPVFGTEGNKKFTVNDRLIMDKIKKTISQYTNDNFDKFSILTAMAEITAEQLEIDRRRIYTFEELVNEILQEYERIKKSGDFSEYIKELIEALQNIDLFDFDKKIKNILIKSKFLIAYHPFFTLDNERIRRFRKFIAITFPKITIANLFISFILSRCKTDA